MKRYLFLGAVVVSALTGCSRSGVIDATGGSTAAAQAPSAPKAAVKRIAFGQRVNLRDYLAPGKTTIFDFTSEFCPPCKAIAPALHKLHAERDDIVVVEVDLNRKGVHGIDWKSPVAVQYGMESIPHFKVYGPDGKLEAEGDKAYGLVTEMLH